MINGSAMMPGNGMMASPRTSNREQMTQRVNICSRLEVVAMRRDTAATIQLLLVVVILLVVISMIHSG